MKIKNLTPDTQKLVVKEIVGEKREYDIYVSPYGVTDIDRMAIKEPKDLSGIFEVEGAIIPIIEKESPVIIDEESNPPEAEESTGDADVIADEAHICDICGAEFGSARGLASHKNRAHSNN